MSTATTFHLRIAITHAFNCRFSVVTCFYSDLQIRQFSGFSRIPDFLPFHKCFALVHCQTSSEKYKQRKDVSIQA